MSKVKDNPTPPAKPRRPATLAETAAPAKPSRVLREERTFTTTRKSWPILWKHPEFVADGKRQVEVKKGIFIELYRHQEFFPTQFIQGLAKNPLFRKWEIQGKEDAWTRELAEFLERYVEATRHVDVMYFDRRPRPMTQIELEEELSDAYVASRAKDSIIAQQDEELENLRARLVELQPKGA